MKGSQWRPAGSRSHRVVKNKDWIYSIREVFYHYDKPDSWTMSWDNVLESTSVKGLVRMLRCALRWARKWAIYEEHDREDWTSFLVKIWWPDDAD